MKQVWQVLTVSALIFAFGTAVAEDDQKLELDVAAQPLAASLRQVAEEFDFTIAFYSDSTEGIKAPALTGTYTPSEALDLLLADTRLEYTYVNETSVAIRPLATVGEPAPGKSRPASSPLMAQNPTSAAQNEMDQGRRSNEDADSRSATKVEEIFVTGSRIRGAQHASPVVTITRQEIDRAGFATIGQLIDTLPQNFGAGATEDSFTDRGIANAVGAAVGDFAGGTSINLRGLGTGATLVLLNGRRLNSSGVEAQFVDVSSIPLSAIDRVEILTDGASAIYGADAIAGVVNFVLRDEYEGAETRLRYGTDSRGDTPEILVAQAFGRSWQRGNFLVAYEYYTRENLPNVDREVAASSDLRPLGGDDFRLIGGNPANISAGGQTYAIPTEQDGTSLTAGDFDASAPPNMYDRRAVEDFLPEQERHTLLLNVYQDISESIELFFEGRFSTRDHRTQAEHTLMDFEVTDTNPYFVDPSGTGLTTIEIENYSFVPDLGPRIIDATTDSYGGTAGVEFDLRGSWQGEISGTWSKSSAVAHFRNEVNLVALEAALAASDPQVAFNPFGDGSNTDPAVLATLRSGGDRDNADNELYGFGLSFDGDIFEASGGAAQAAAGVEYRHEAIGVSLIEGSNREAPVFTPGLDRSRAITAAYAELFLPLVGEPNSKPGIRRLEVSIAGRYEDYSDFGSAVSPKLGVLWSPADSLTLKGTVGKSFKAPLLSDLDVSNLSDNRYVYFPQVALFPVHPIILLGGNENLDAETATSWTAGFKFTPDRVRGLSADVTYFNIDFEDRVRRAFGDLRRTFDPQFSAIQNFDPTPEEIAAVVNDPRWDEVFGVSAADVLSGVAPVGAIIDARTQNIAKSKVSGVEFLLSYEVETGIGDFDASLNGNYLIDFSRAELDTLPLIDEVDTLGRPVDFRARGSVAWSRGDWGISGFVNYTDGYTDNVSDPQRPIGSWTTVDLQLVYRAHSIESVERTQFALSFQNLLDEDPPFANTAGGLAYDSVNANGLGRFISLGLSKQW